MVFPSFIATKQVPPAAPMALAEATDTAGFAELIESLALVEVGAASPLAKNFLFASAMHTIPLLNRSNLRAAA
jgi:hypothetical protein